MNRLTCTAQKISSLSLIAIGLVFCFVTASWANSCTRHVYNDTDDDWYVNWAIIDAVSLDTETTLNGEMTNAIGDIRKPGSYGGGFNGGTLMEPGTVMTYTLKLVGTEDPRNYGTIRLSLGSGQDDTYDETFDLVQQSGGGWCQYIRHDHMSRTGRAVLNEPANGDVTFIE